MNNQISRTAPIVVNDRIERTFLLFGPMQEKRWAHGWNPEWIFPGEDYFSKGIVFQTPSFHEKEPNFTWVLSHISHIKFELVYTVFTQNRVWIISINCFEKEPSSTLVEITYTYTGHNQFGDELNRIAMDVMFREDLKDWERAINHYLTTGEQLVE